jgi:hypothetical protein
MTDDVRATEQNDAAELSSSERSSKLQALDALVGDWALGDPSAPVGRTSYSWLEGGFFLVQRWTVDIPEAPDGIAILGEDATTGGLVQHYYDSRGVARVYGMSLDGGVWRLWREGPDFWQRFTGTFSEDGTTISGTWESSPDGSNWQHDFNLLYTRVS